MIECRYNPIDLRYKNTIGAVKQGELLTIRIEINNALPCTSVLYKEFDDPTHTEIYRKMAKVSDDGEFSLYEVSYKPIIGLYWYCFELEGCAPKRFVGVGADNKPCLFKSNPFWWQLTVYDNQYKTPDWLNKGVMYHIFVDRFCSLGQVIPYEDKYLREWGQQPNYKPSSNGKILNNDFFGGNINGIISKLDYLATLNVKVIYLSPIFSAYSNHKYDTEDYETIDSMFGSEKDFKQLCKEAESRGMSIMLDGVFNHTGVN
ncbi:MAG: alpha-amylase family glycosyl hydrolase, partial [Clostridia bacterium]